jgi:Mannosyltransferase (PIG-V)
MATAQEPGFSNPNAASPEPETLPSTEDGSGWRSVFLNPGSIRAMLLKVARDRSVRSALFSFTTTRAIVLLLFVLTAQIHFMPSSPEGGVIESSFSLHRTPVSHILSERLTRADSGWYIQIAREGYARRPFATDNYYNWAFFPLFPLLLRMAAMLTGEFALTGMVLSSLFLLAALIILHKTATAYGLDLADADRTVFYLTVFPVSYFFSLPLTESLFLLLTVGSFYAAKRESWWAAGILGALASATRMTGVVLLPCLVVLYWETSRTWKPKAKLLPLLLIPTGVLAYMCFLFEITGNAFAFKDITIAWGREPGFFLTPLWTYLQDPMVLSVAWDMRAINFLGASTALVCGLVLLKWRKWALGRFAVACMVISLSSTLLQSQARYSMVIFPMFMVLAIAGRRPRIDQLIRTSLLFLFILMTLMFSFNVDAALS